MTNIIAEIEKEQIAKLNKNIPTFRPGDTLKVGVEIVELGGKHRVQFFIGTCIAYANKGINSNFVVRKLGDGVGVEKRFPIYSPLIASIEVLKHGKVRRAKLTYLRGRAGKSARIKERIVASKV